MRSFNLLQTRNGRFLTFFLLYVSEGVPQGFTGTAMASYMRREGLGIEQIGFFIGALGLPWAFKWLWAPLVDLIKLDSLGGRKAWIMFCTVMMAVTLLAAAFFDFTTDFRILTVVLVINNIFVATQDIAIDSLAVSSLHEDERGRGAGFMFGGAAIGVGLGGGGAMYVSGLVGFNAAGIYITGILCLNLIFVALFVHDPDAGSRTVEQAKAGLRILAGSLYKLYLKIFASFFSSGRGPKAGLIFYLFPAGTFALVGSTYTTLLVDVGLTDFQIGDVNIIGNIIYSVGCILGGFLGDRFGLRKVMAASYALTVIPTLLLAVQISDTGIEGLSIITLYGVIWTHWLFSGMCFGLAVAVVMKLTNPAVAASQFTAFMALGNLASSMANVWQAKVAEEMGYAMLFYLDSALVMLPILVIPFLTGREEPV